MANKYDHLDMYQIGSGATDGKGLAPTRGLPILRNFHQRQKVRGLIATMNSFARRVYGNWSSRLCGFWKSAECVGRFAFRMLHVAALLV